MGGCKYVGSDLWFVGRYGGLSKRVGTALTVYKDVNGINDWIGTSITAWAADTVTAVGDMRRATADDKDFILVCSSIAGDAKTHATTEPTWGTFTIRGTIVDDQVTWVKVQPAINPSRLDKGTDIWCTALITMPTAAADYAVMAILDTTTQIYTFGATIATSGDISDYDDGTLTLANENELFETPGGDLRCLTIWATGRAQTGLAESDDGGTTWVRQRHLRDEWAYIRGRPRVSVINNVYSIGRAHV